MDSRVLVQYVMVALILDGLSSDSYAIFSVGILVSDVCRWLHNWPRLQVFVTAMV